MFGTQPKSISLCTGDVEAQDDEQTGLLQQQRQQQQQQEAIQLDGEISYNEALIEEREEGISHIQHSIDDIHQMTMVRLSHMLSAETGAIAARISLCSGGIQLVACSTAWMTSTK